MPSVTAHQPESHRRTTQPTSVLPIVGQAPAGWAPAVLRIQQQPAAIRGVSSAPLG
jgi:hypothetical protein